MLKAIRALFDWVFPIYCIGCEKDHYLICGQCLQRLNAVFIQTCPNCAKPSDYGYFCSGCQSGQLLGGLLVAFVYEKKGSLARMLHLFKYEGFTAYGQKLADLLAQRVSADFSGFIEKEIDLITWVPLSRRKYKIRGFNQTEKLARSLPAVGDKLPLLCKIRETRSQMQLKRRERLENLTGSFGINTKFAGLIAGKNILIVDDIATTLATLTEMAGVLKSAGARSVHALVLARQKE